MQNRNHCGYAEYRDGEHYFSGCGIRHAQTAAARDCEAHDTLPAV